MGLDVILEQMPGGAAAYGAMGIVISGMAALYTTRNAWASILVAFAVCWGMTVFNFIPLFVSLICTMTVFGGMLAWRLFYRE